MAASKWSGFHPYAKFGKVFQAVLEMLWVEDFFVATQKDFIRCLLLAYSFRE